VRRLPRREFMGVVGGTALAPVSDCEAGAEGN
jgi:hypothetical protein